MMMTLNVIVVTPTLKSILASSNAAFLGVHQSASSHQLVPCSFARELFDQGLSSLTSKPVCDSENSDLYLEKQCNQKVHELHFTFSRDIVLLELRLCQPRYWSSRYAAT